MFTLDPQKKEAPEEGLASMVTALEALLEGETDLIAGLSNSAALIKAYLEDVNWVGFYILKGKELVLGPFQGLPACSRIGEGKGVCGKAVEEGKALIVADVHAFPGHIACDSASNSEMVIPLFKGGQIYGVLDIDSPRLNRFSALEADYLCRAGRLISGFLKE